MNENETGWFWGTERIRQLEEQGFINFVEGEELSQLRMEKMRLEREEEERRQILEKEREGKKVFILTYRQGNIFQDPEKMELVKEEIWAETATEAAELACRRMISQETIAFLTGVEITDALSCRLDVFEGDQREEHEPVLVNPYGIAPSRIADGGPTGFAESALKALTGRNDLEIRDGKIELEDTS